MGGGIHSNGPTASAWTPTTILLKLQFDINACHNFTGCCTYPAGDDQHRQSIISPDSAPPVLVVVLVVELVAGTGFESSHPHRCQGM
jgi:hypothetical protein